MLKKLLLGLASLFCLASAPLTVHAQQAVVVSACGLETIPISTQGQLQHLRMDATGLVCFNTGNTTASLADLDAIKADLDQLVTAAGSVAPVTLSGSACNIIKATANAHFYALNGNANSANLWVWVFNSTTAPADGTPADALKMISPMKLPAAGFWSLATVVPGFASAGFTVCTSSTGPLTFTKVTSTDLTNNTISGFVN